MKTRQARKILKNVRVNGLYDYYRVSAENAALANEHRRIIRYLASHGISVGFRKENGS